MLGFDIIDSTTRAGVRVDEVEFEVPDAPPATAYVLGRLPAESQPVVVGLHHGRGNKSALLRDMEHLSARGFLSVSLDSPGTRHAMANRDPLGAFEQYFSIAATALNLLQGDPDIVDHRVGLVGRGIGGEVAAALAAHSNRCRVVVAYNSLLQRSRFVAESPHPIPAGLRWAHTPEHVQAMTAGLGPRDLSAQLQVATDTHWMLQVADDDDRLDTTDRELLSMGIPHAVRVRHHRAMLDLVANPARLERIDFISHLLG